MNIKPIRTVSDYEDALVRIEDIIDAAPGSAEADELEVLAILVEQFESQFCPIDSPTPLEAVRFRMEQQGLTAKDLEPFLGTRSRVSEVLSGKRSLSLDMMRALHEHLGIPAEALIGKADQSGDRLTLSASAERLLVSWKLKSESEDLQHFLTRAFGSAMAPAMFRKTRTARTNAKTDHAALSAWCAGVMLKSQQCNLKASFHQTKLTGDFLRQVSKLSAVPAGPKLVVQELSSIGIALVVLPHLPNTFLDGAAMCRSDNVPVIALTLRRDRVDNFWFTLLHELAHLQCEHLNREKRIIVDDLELGSEEDIEAEADKVAQDALIPPRVWATFNSGPFCSLGDITEASAKAGVSPAVIAGRWQRENRDFRKFSRLLGHNTIRRHFVADA